MALQMCHAQGGEEKVSQSYDFFMSIKGIMFKVSLKSIMFELSYECRNTPGPGHPGMTAA